MLLRRESALNKSIVKKSLFAPAAVYDGSCGPWPKGTAVNQNPFPIDGTGRVSLSSSRHDNLLLSSLSQNDYNSIAAHLQPEELELGRTLYHPNEAISLVYFLISGLGSCVSEAQDGGNVEVGVIGWEGLAGIPVLLGSDRTPNRVFMQVPGEALAISPNVLVSLMNESQGLRTVLHKYVHVYMMQLSQTAACNRIHDVRERLARWLLMSHDRCQRCEVMPLTHEFLGLMLGTRRSSVTVAAGMLQAAGMIDYKHGSVKILNREALEDAACDCYAIVRQEQERVFPNIRHDFVNS
jgi:CRP-like cAMP-binding protein